MNDHDYQAWGFRDRLTINEASFLWFNLRPRLLGKDAWMAGAPPLPPGAGKNASLLREELKRAVYQGEIKAHNVRYVPDIPDDKIPAGMDKHLFRSVEADVIQSGNSSEILELKYNRPPEIDARPEPSNQKAAAMRMKVEIETRKKRDAYLALMQLMEKARSVPDPTTCYEEWEVAKGDLILFAENRKQAPRFLFGDTRDELFRLKDEIGRLKVENEQLKSTAHRYLDQNHPQYSAKLHAAVLFWEEHFADGKDGVSNMKAVFQNWYEKDWLKVLSGDKFESTSQDHVAKIATPRDRKGGRRKKQR